MNDDNSINDYVIQPNSKRSTKRIFPSRSSSYPFRLEDEEQTRQKLQLERTQLESKIKQFEDIIASQQNDLARIQKERKTLDDKLQETSNQRQDEEEKLKTLLRTKTKLESQTNDLDERLKREIEVRFLITSLPLSENIFFL